MDADDTAIVNLSDRELGELISELTIEIAALQEQVEPTSGSAKRTWRLVRSTILMTGGLFAATIEIWTVILALLGLWDWIDTIREDVAFTNRQNAISQQLTDLEFKLAIMTVELRKRKQASSELE